MILIIIFKDRRIGIIVRITAVREERVIYVCYFQLDHLLKSMEKDSKYK